MAADPDRYLLAAFRPDADRGALEAEARGDPEAEAMLRASYALRDTLGEAEAFRRHPGSGDALAFLAANRLVDASRDPSWVRILDRLEQRVLASDESRSAYERLMTRIVELERDSDAPAHFRRLTGGGSSRVIPLRTLAAAAAIALVSIAGAAVAGHLVEDPVARAAHASLRASAEARAAFRGDPVSERSVLARAARARYRFLGIWPVYDGDELERLDRRLRMPTTATDWFVAARVRLMAGDRERGRAALRMAVDLGAGPEAERLLERVSSE